MQRKFKFRANCNPCPSIHPYLCQPISLCTSLKETRESRIICRSHALAPFQESGFMMPPEIIEIWSKDDGRRRTRTIPMPE
ncbi:hypothetical protein PGT21_007785 [Puccinia graminis f. sp. tritici]|uniref:Uncharacterized protein n=1 Tax=Puccinia graminis f. sp. tritici TaxID=56615 RepID=A0A5B0ML27_PUCGR|nr:hypothetical protein PGT21_007785 [Puccinia graminis f. sp. tritici]